MMIDPAQQRTIAELHSQAGHRYAEAARNYVNAWIELVGVGIAATNRHVDAIAEGERLVGYVAPNVQTLAPFLPSITTPDVLKQRANQRAMDLLASLEL